MSTQDTKDVARTAAKVATEASWSQTRAILRVILIVLAVAVTLWVIVKLTGVILLLILSIFFAYFVYPLVAFLSRPIHLAGRQFSIPRTLAIGLSYVLIVAVIVVGIYFLAPSLGSQFPEFTEQARQYWNGVGTKMQGMIEYFRSHRMPGTLLDAINGAIPSVIEKISQNVSAVLGSMVGWVAFIPWLVLIPVLSFFLLKDVDTFRRSALQMLPKGRWRWRGDEFFQDINSTLAAYIRAQLTACVFIGVVCALGFTILGLPSPLVLGVIAGVCEFVPLVGPLLVAVVAAVLALLHAGPFSAVLALVFLAILRIVQDYWIYPRLIGQGIHLHPLAVIVAILSGAELAGIAGIFLAIPAVAILTVSYRHWLEHRGSEGLADLLEPTPIGTGGALITDDSTLVSDREVKHLGHPDADTTPEEMAHARPDLTTGELKMPVDD
ncbi:MAG TPA: AI-2E family transporter [Pyrinomonadaceae bacterium]|nr:AI-2E family transporter [Pyrinomonadaceae bacterium]